VFDNGVLRRMFGPKGDEVTREWRILLNEELNDLNSSPNIVWEIKLRMRWTRNVDCMGRGEVYKGVWWRNMRERDNLGDPGVDW
jgi:hypothetical protein